MADTGFNVKSGILDPKHRDKMGIAVWEFLWCIDKTTKETVDRQGITWGTVLGGMPIMAERIADALGTHTETVKKNLRKLTKCGYLRMKRTPYGNIIDVNNSGKWRPKEMVKPPDITPKTAKFLITFKQELGRLPSPTEIAALEAYTGDGLEEELICEAIRRAKKAGQTYLKYIEAILISWRDAQIYNMTQVGIKDKDFEQKKLRNKAQSLGKSHIKSNETNLDLLFLHRSNAVKEEESFDKKFS